jgi:uncharacterized protein
MNCLTDVNVWLALSLIGHVHHPAARKWFDEAESDRILFCRVTQKGLLRLLTNQRVMGANTLSAAEAWRLYDTLCQDGRVQFAEEPPELEEAWRAQTRGGQTGANFWTDAYLAAFAASAGCTLVTFDRQFARRKDVDVKVLS